MRAAAVAALVLAFALPAAGAEVRRAALKLESTAPVVVVSGRHFGAREPVLLTYVGDETSRAAGARANATGSFRVTFPVRAGRCDSFTVRATGARGSRAVLQVVRACGRKGPPERALVAG